MDKPIQFITIDNDGKCGMTNEAQAFIENIEENLAVVCVAGLYRTGKSYLLNRLLDRQDGFEIGPTINSCTKGIWIWGVPVTLEDKNYKVLLIDTEGLGSAFEDRNETIDMEIFCLGIFLSSLFIYNSKNNIDEAAVENLGLVLNFAKKIQSTFKEVDNYTNNFPSLLWVLRDFALNLTDKDGNSLTPSEYLEEALRVNDNSKVDEVKKKNEIRKLLKIFFKERDCYTLIRPVDDEKKLRTIDKIPVSDIRPEFMEQMNDLVKKIYSVVRPKVVQGSFLNGKTYISLVKMYIESLNNNALPDVKTSWKIVIDQQMELVYEKSVDYYLNEMINLDLLKISKVEELISYHNKHKIIAYDYLKEFSNINIPAQVYIDIMMKFEDKINDHLLDFVNKWNEVSSKQCQVIFNIICRL